MKEQYKFSIVTAVYNVEAFLAEMIDSVVNQTIGLEHIQLILVNDGSTDGSGAICDRYAKEYPDNIVVIHKENGGVSSARNEGLKHVRGELVNFLDSDDKLAENTLENVYNFYQEHRNETDLIAIPLYFFDGQTGDHILNYKFNKGTRVVDLDAEWENPQLSLSSAFVRWEAFQGLEFDPRLKYAEDAQLIQKVLLRKHTMGLVQEATYFYRRRSEGEQSAVQAGTMRKAWYNDYLKYFSLNIMEYCVEKEGFVPLFVQNTVMYDIQWRLKLQSIPAKVLSDQERTEFYLLLKQVLDQIDDVVICKQKNIAREHKIFALRIKHGDHLKVRELDQDMGLVSGNSLIYKMSTFPVRLEFLRVGKDQCEIEGTISLFYNPYDSYEIVAGCHGNEYAAYFMQHKEDGTSLGERVYHQDIFKVQVPLTTDAQEIRLYLKVGNKKIELTDIRKGSFLPVCGAYEYSFDVQNGWMLQLQENRISLSKCTAKQKAWMERKFRMELWKSNDLGARKAVVARILTSFFQHWKRKPLWIISDRTSKAGDNGEALYRYLNENHPEICSYFVINGKCEDYKRLKKIGKVVATDSFKHKLLVLLSDYVISSHAEVEIYNPFMGYSNSYRDLLAKGRFIFLQHGVIIHNLGGWLNKYNKNLYGFITSSIPENASILDPSAGYFYTDQEVWLTGLPRYDRLYRDEKRQVTIMPTWRRYTMSHIDRATGQWLLKAGFEESTLFKFYNALLNHERLIQAAERCGYTIKFFPHPNLQVALPLFDRNEHVEFLDVTTQYRDVYAQSDLVVSDYSSAVYDFAYLRKPIIYTQFDASEFFGGDHVCQKGYFEYERDGFGEVEYDLEATVDRIIEYMENGCQMKDKYKARVDQFFAYNDQNNCQRVYERIMELEQENER